MNRVLGPWLVRAGVQEALQTSPVRIDNPNRQISDRFYSVDLYGRSAKVCWKHM